MNELELLRRYAREGSQPAFQAVVARYINLVYSAARRQVHSPDLAAEVAQAVFLELAASIPKLRDDSQLGSWLLVATRRRAIDVVRREATRERIERAAAEDRAMNAPSASWSQLEPVLDEALASLREDDRQAIVLRFFENRALREIAVALGCTEDTAQKRVSRALDRLRGHFSDRGLVTVAAVLASELATRAVEAAPAGTASSITTAVMTRLAAVVRRQALRAAVVAHVQLAVLTTALVGSSVFLAYEAYVHTQIRREIVSLGGVADRWRTELRALRRSTAAHRLAAAKADAFVSADPDFDERVRAALIHLAEQRRRFAANPSQQTPELRLLSFQDWLQVAQSHSRWDTDDGWSEAMSSIRNTAIQRTGLILEVALERYVSATRGQLPTSMDELAPLCDPTLGADILARYEVKRTGSIGTLADHEQVIAEKNEAVVDPNDGLSIVGFHWSGVTAAQAPRSIAAWLNRTSEEAAAGYRATHGGQSPPSQDPELLRPYISDPEKAEAYVDIMRQFRDTDVHFKQENAIGDAINAYRSAHRGYDPKVPKDIMPYFKYASDAELYFKHAAPRVGDMNIDAEHP